MASQNLGDSQNDIQPQKILQKALHNLNAILDGYSISDKKIDNWILKKYVKMQTIPFLKVSVFPHFSCFMFLEANVYLNLSDHFYAIANSEMHLMYRKQK